jgi:uncharacterized 2Fe-2S/4Fe-4S cluster protein (DUF4445 family)
MHIKLSSGKILDSMNDENLLQAFKRQGVYLVASCGGKGICGKCRIRISKGEHHTASQGKLHAQDIESGVVLACQTFPESDISVDIPKESQLVVGDVLEISRTKDLLETFRASGEILSPLVKWIPLEVTPPTIDDNIGDLERLIKSLEAEGLKDMRFPHGFLSSMATELRDARWNVHLGYIDGPEAVFLAPSARKDKYGLAVDIGTTTVVMYLVNLADGSLVDVGSTYNSQIRYGDDVITRIMYAAEAGGLKELQDTVVTDMNDLLMPMIEKHAIEEKNIDSVVISGNTTMTHLFWGLTPGFIREEPYTPTLNFFPVWKADSAGLKIGKQVPVYTVPCVASYVGGDIVAGVLASNMHKQSGITLFMDIGTNGEIVIGNNEWLVTAACSAGPCFEGSGIRHGMRATEGAVESLTINPQTFVPSLSVIGNSSPIGICGSGMIDAITEMFLTGVIDQKGKFIRGLATKRIRDGFEGPEFLISRDEGRDILLTEVDIENILRAKAAIYAGVSLLVKKVGLTLNDIERIYIAGGFGNYLNIEKSIIIGMLPDVPREKFRFLGNTAIAGTYLCLLSEKMREEAEEIAGKMTNVELSVSRRFMDEYMSALFLPHTDIGQFPTVKKLLRNKD